jgi:hypothetical protein
MKSQQKLPRFPEIREAMSRAIANRKAEAKVAMKQIIDELIEKAGISIATFWNYRRGDRPVPEDKAPVMAEYFYPNKPEEASKFVKALEQAREKESTVQRGAGNRLAEGQPLRLDITKYPPFSEAVEKMIRHLCRLSNLTTTEDHEHKRNFDMRQALWQNEIDLAVGYFANLYRAVHVHFWPTPIKIGLGAVVLREHGTKKELELIRDVLAGGRIGSRSLLHPVLVEREIGEIHCRKTLEYQGDDVEYVENMTAENLEAKGVAETLKQTQKRTGKIAVAVLDEWSSFHVLKNLGSQGVPVLPLSSRKETRDAPRRELPASFLSIGCSREQPELRDVMDQSLNLFLATEVESNALKLASLHEDLLREVTAVVRDHYPKRESGGTVPELLKKADAEAFKTAYGWALYVLGLDHQSMESPIGGLPWGPIVKRARERALFRLADEEHKETIREVIELELGPEDVTPSEDKFRKLCEALDLRMDLRGPQREYVLEDREILLRTIRDGLRGQPVGLPIEKKREGGRVENLSPKAEPGPAGESLEQKKIREEKRLEKIRVLDGFLRDLQEFYEKRIGDQDMEAGPASKHIREDAPDRRIKDFRSRLQEQYRSQASAIKSGKKPREMKGPRLPGAETVFGEHKDDRILLASFGKSPSRYMGSACLRPYRQNAKWLELFYLWVRPDYRQFAVGDRIISKAKQYALDNKYESLVIKVLPTLNEAITYFRKREFERLRMSEDNRLILVAKPKPEEDE